MSFDRSILRHTGVQLVLDLSDAPDTGGVDLAPALAAMAALEGGAVANVSEGRQVGHYWLRDPARAPSDAIAGRIRTVLDDIDRFDAGECDTVLLVGIGGSALGPEFAFDALASARPTRRLVVLDTVDPAGMAHILHPVDPSRTLAIVASKSGTTAETRTALRTVEAHWAESGACFADKAVAVTGIGSPLAALAAGWRATFPVWEWVGGRTSLTSAVGLLPLSLCGIDTTELLAGARTMDAWTRQVPADNPAAQLAAVWWVAGRGRGDRALVIQPYIDRYQGLSRYIQQLAMESLGKCTSRDGADVVQGLAVYGNKGSADQHALLQQLQDGRDDALVHFIATVGHPTTTPLQLEAADLQLSLLEGTRDALASVGRPSVTIQLADAGPRSLGALIALFERAVGLYAELADINAYDQPGVERGKRATAQHLAAHGAIADALDATPVTAAVLAQRVGMDPGRAWRILTQLSATHRASVITGERPSEDRFSSVG
jgi:glucose-6-phosphate isomerase